MNRLKALRVSGVHYLLLTWVAVFSTSCCTCFLDPDDIDYSPVAGYDWPVSTPEEQGLEPKLIARFYCEAAELETMYGLLVVKNGYLIAEDYFNEGSIDQLAPRQSITKSFTSAAMGIAIDLGYIDGVDEKMMDFFPEISGDLTDVRKNSITIEELLQMRAGYPNEEKMPQYLDALFFTDNWDWVPHMANFPLVREPGTGFDYSNLTSHILGMIVARATGTDLNSFTQEHVLSPIGAVAGEWTTDADGNNWGWGELSITARDMAKFGKLYMEGGEWAGDRVIPSDWVADSLAEHSEKVVIGGYSTSRYGNFRKLGYGYQWWSAEVGEHRFSYANGHGGQFIILLDDLDMIIVTIADPLKGADLAGSGGWK
jgi:CubicO group peptidase (beta-lactamase class C family)